MKPMTGEIGKWVVDGKQVGGFRAWTARVRIQPPIKSRVIAEGFWVLEEINTDKVKASFYCENGDSLKLVSEREAILHLPENYELDKLILTPVEMTFGEDFDWRDG